MVAMLTLVIIIMLASPLFSTKSIIRGDSNTNSALTIAVLFQPAYAQPQHQEFTAKMTGDQEVPSKNTAATGTVTFEPTPAEMTLAQNPWV
jgi:hypothetical protein